MHVVEPRKREDGKWEMVIRTMSPARKPVSICLEAGTMGKGKNATLTLRPCRGHADSLAARQCPHAKKIARRAELYGVDQVLEDLTEAPRYDDREIETINQEIETVNQVAPKEKGFLGKLFSGSAER